MNRENHFWNLLVQIFMKITSTKINWILFFQSFKNLEWLFFLNLFLFENLIDFFLNPKTKNWWFSHKK
jgi:hypothetical protein